MHTRNVNVKTAAQESSRNRGKTVSYTILVAETKKNSEENRTFWSSAALQAEETAQTLPRNNALHLFLRPQQRRR